jgi:hypothetical protein
MINLLARGYRITHNGILCWAPIPTLKYRLLLCSLFRILETVFAFTLWAMASRTNTHGMPKLLPWSIEDLEYEGLCSHPALWESIIDENQGLNREQIAIKEREAAVRSKVSMRQTERNYHARLARRIPLRMQPIAARRAKRDTTPQRPRRGSAASRATPIFGLRER